MTKCLNQGCENLITSIIGRRPRLYCSNNCKQKDWQRKQKEKITRFRGKDGIPLPKDYVGIGEVLTRTINVAAKKPIFKPKVAPKPKKSTEVPKKEETAENPPQNELQPPDGLSPIALMVWKNEQKLKANPKILPVMTFGNTKKT